MATRVLFIVLLLCGHRGFTQVDEVVPFTSSNLPIVVINTGGASIPDEDKITADMGIIYNGADRNNITDPFNNFSGTIGIEIRGSSSQMFPKKQYGIELRDETGDGIDASLLALPEEEDWVLFAPYNDKSLMRDVLAYKLGHDLGRYAPRTKFCELVLNGEYRGVYVLIEKVKRSKDRVDINKLNPDEVSGNDVTGGYILKIDKETGGGGDGWFSEYRPPNGSTQKIFFQYEYPKSDDIVPEQKTYIKEYVDQFEDALAASSFADPLNGYAKFIDVNSFVDFFIMQEVTKNVDGYRLSTFFYKQKDTDGGKLVMGPLWDFNLGFGNADYCTSGNPEGFVLDFNTLCNDDTWLIPFWWKRLLQDNTFRMKVAARWVELRAGKFQTGVINTYIDSVASVLNVESQQRNFKAWKVLNKYVWPNYYVGPTFAAEVSWLKGWVTQRLSWLDENMPSLVTGTEEEVALTPSVTAYPNPFTSQLTITYTIQQPGDVQVRIVDPLGRTLQAVTLPHNSSGAFTYAVAGDMKAGLYFYSVQQGSLTLGKGKISRE